MRFGKTLRQSIHQPWKDYYVDYAKLKTILRDEKDDDDPWTDEDERRFGDELLNVQLEKVARFHDDTFKQLRDRADAAFARLKDLSSSSDSPGEPQPTEDDPKGKGKGKAAGPVVPPEDLAALEAELDRIINDVRELKAFGALNYTAFLKIVKKHDRKRGSRYRIRPMMMARLAQRPFNSEQKYTPLLHKLGLMYYAVRQHIEDGDPAVELPVDLREMQPEIMNGERYTAHKFWVHPDNLLEVKTYILRRLPALVYSQQSSKEVDGSDDPRLSSLYFDNSKLALYLKKVEQQDESTSLRLRWYGQLDTKPDIFLEHKTVFPGGSSEERKFTIKEKYIKSFLDGDYKMEKTIQKWERQGRSAEDIENFKSTVNGIQDSILKNKVEPLVRANYVRTAFQKPADDRVRISIDTELVFVREDVLDPRHTCRDPEDWHRRDIDNRMTYPFNDINPSEISRFPHAVLEIKLKEDNNRRRPAWVEDLMASHLVHPVPRFSKFAHGVASLFDDYVNTLPFWLSDLETDIRKDPKTAFLAEEQRKMERAEDEMVVGSFLGARGGSFKPSRSSPMGKSYLADRVSAEAGQSQGRSVSVSGPLSSARDATQRQGSVVDDDATAASEEQQQQAKGGYGTLSSVLPSFSMTRYARAKREREAAQAQLPEGVAEPTEWIKNSGPLKVEPKVWLANERTFLKWQHIGILLGSLAVALYTAAAGRHQGHGHHHTEDEGRLLARILGVVYILMAMFAGGWGWWMYNVRRRMIMDRSGQDFDNGVGPIVVSCGLAIALVLNFVFAYGAALERWEDEAGGVNGTMLAYGVDELR